MKRAIVQRVGSLSSYRYGVETYDSTKLGLGKMMTQKNDAGNEGKWVGPSPMHINLAESGGAVGLSDSFTWSNTATSQIDWVFLGDGASAGATRKLSLCTYNRLTGVYAYSGYVTLTPSTATNHTVRGIRVTLDRYTTGTVSVSGTAVTGVGSLWSTSRLAVGSRIGFGSTDHTQITTWYEISAIGSDTGITLTSTAGTIAAGTPYVIEDLRCHIITTNATAANGGLYTVKGLRPEIFVTGGTTIPAATTVDNIRAVYWLKDNATTNVNTVANGMGLEPKVDWQTQYVWVGNGTTTQQLFKHNVRAALTLTAGASNAGQWLFSTGVSATLTGTATQQNNGCIATTSQGDGGGVPCYYFTTGTRIYRTKPISTIISGDTTFITLGNTMICNWPAGSTNVGGASLSAIQNISYDPTHDMFLVTQITGSSDKNFLTKWRNDSTPMDRMFGNVEHRMTTYAGGNVAAMGGVADADLIYAYTQTVNDGMYYCASIVTATGGAWAIPYGADWEYTASTKAVVIFPAITLTNADRLNYVMAQESQTLGTSTSGYNLSPATLPHRIKYRTSGISDDTGAWTLVDQTGALDIAGVSQIQFAFEFRTMGNTMWSSRIHSLSLIYDDNSTIDNYEFSADKSSASTKKFAWWFATAFGSTVPALRVRLYDNVSGSLLVDDNTNAPTGTFEKSTDGTTWVAWTNADRGNNTTYLRYTPLSIADNVNTQAVLTLL